jgi:hypothetical protein
MKNEVIVLEDIVSELNKIKELLESNSLSLDYLLAAAFVSEAVDNLESRLTEINTEETVTND